MYVIEYSYCLSPLCLHGTSMAFQLVTFHTDCLFCVCTFTCIGVTPTCLRTGFWKEGIPVYILFVQYGSRLVKKFVLWIFLLILFVRSFAIEGNTIKMGVG